MEYLYLFGTLLIEQWLIQRGGRTPLMEKLEICLCLTYLDLYISRDHMQH